MQSFIFCELYWFDLLPEQLHLNWILLDLKLSASAGPADTTVIL